MTVSAETVINRYTAAAEQKIFVYGFTIQDEDHVLMYVDDTLQTIVTDYTVDNVGVVGGGNVTSTLEDGMVGGEAVTLIRVTPATQDSDYVENDAFPAESHEAAIDKLTALVQDLQEEVDRCLKYHRDSTNVDVLISGHTAISAETLTGYITFDDEDGTTRKIGVIS